MFAKKRVLTGVMATVLAAAMLFSACTPTNNAGTGSGTGSGVTGTNPTAVNYPGTSDTESVTVNLATEPPDMFSVTTQDAQSFNLLRHLMEGLVTLDPEDRVKPGVAESWDISEDQLTYTFHLRNDFTWTNGEKVTANDFKYAWISLLNPDFAASYAYFGYVFKNGQAYNEGKAKAEDVAIKVVDDYTLEVTLENVTPYFLSQLAFGVFMPLNEKAYAEFGDKYATDADKIVTNGPYKMESWQHESEVVLVKHDAYPKAADIKIPKIIWKMIKDTNTKMNMFKSNEMDMCEVNGDEAAALKAEGWTVNTYDDGSVWYLTYECNDKFLKNANLRKAITLCIDSESFVTNVVKNSSKPATQFVPLTVNGNKDKFANEVGSQFKSHDIESAKAALAEAMKELGVTNAKDIEVSLMTDDTTAATKYSAYLQENIASELGITVKVETMPFKSRIARMNEHDFSIVMAGWSPDYNDPMTYLDMFVTGSGNNNGEYSNPKYDELIAKAQTEIDPDKRFEYLMECERILMTDFPIGPYYYRAQDFITSAKLKGVVRTAFQDINLCGAEIVK